MPFDTALAWILSLINLWIIGIAVLFTYESVREQEPRASMDNILYGKRWRPRKALDWIDYPKGASSKNVPAFEGDA